LSVGHDFANLNTRNCVDGLNGFAVAITWQTPEISSDERENYQSEWAKDGQAWDTFQAELEERQKYDDEIEYVPTLSKIEFRADGNQFECGFNGECGREELISKW
jgi:hypothetical protein